MPEVKIDTQPPHVMASRFPNGTICIATEGRVKPEASWYHPLANITLDIDDGKEPIGIFGHYKTLTLSLNRNIPKGTIVFAQDLLADKAINITSKIKINENKLTIDGQLIDNIGTSENKPGDISMPGLLISLQMNSQKTP